MSEPNRQDLLAAAREIVRSEAASIAAVAETLTEAVARAILLIHDKTRGASPGSVVLSGIGKSGLVGQRISASFASTGTPSHFLHPVEALHGDLGRVRRNDAALLLSYSGETDELVRLLDHLKRQEVAVLAITSSRHSSLGRLSDIAIEIGKIEEVCPHGLAPTTSVNCISAVGDALVLGVMSVRNFSREEFAAFHPAGTLGRKLLKVEQVMEFRAGENFAAVGEDVPLREVLARDPATGRRAGAVVVVDGRGALSGVFTDGDLRRHLRDAAVGDLLGRPMGELMTREPKRIAAGSLASEALGLLNRYRIDELPVVDEGGRPVGLVDVQDLVRLRVVE